MSDKILALAKKLHELAERGVGGEKENAAVAFERMVKKYDIDINLIIGNKKTTKWFRLSSKKIKFFLQVYASVTGTGEYFVKKHQKGSYRSIGVEVTEADFLEISAKFDFYWVKYQQDLELFYSAFVQKNHLYIHKADDDSRSLSDLSPEEKEQLWKISNMMDGLDKHSFQKRIES